MLLLAEARRPARCPRGRGPGSRARPPARRRPAPSGPPRRRTASTGRAAAPGAVPYNHPGRESSTWAATRPRNGAGVKRVTGPIPVRTAQPGPERVAPDADSARSAPGQLQPVASWACQLLALLSEHLDARQRAPGNGAHEELPDHQAHQGVWHQRPARPESVPDPHVAAAQLRQARCATPPASHGSRRPRARTRCGAPQGTGAGPSATRRGCSRDTPPSPPHACVPHGPPARAPRNGSAAAGPSVLKGRGERVDPQQYVIGHQ